MGCSQSSPIDPDAAARNKEIEGLLKKQKQEMASQVRILLLGAGESGKSTVLKQMRLMYDGEYNEQERLAYREIVFTNTVQCMLVVLHALPGLGLELQPGNVHARTTVTEMKLIDIKEGGMPTRLTQALVRLWRDPAVVDAVARSKEFQLNDSAKYFFESVERFSQPNYIPTNQDILRSRVKTTGITQTTFLVDNIDYIVVDVGGQRSERRKWIHCFETVTALIFIVSLSEYDQVLYEDESVNRMAEALTLFEAVVNSRWFTKTTMILFLNKIDILREKLAKSPLKDYFPDYTGPSGNSDESYKIVCDFFKKRFLSANHSRHRVVSHLTCATDSKQVKVIIRSVNDHILKRNLQQIGFA